MNAADFRKELKQIDGRLDLIYNGSKKVHEIHYKRNRNVVNSHSLLGSLPERKVNATMLKEVKRQLRNEANSWGRMAKKYGHYDPKKLGEKWAIDVEDADYYKARQDHFSRADQIRNEFKDDHKWNTKIKHYMPFSNLKRFVHGVKKINPFKDV